MLILDGRALSFAESRAIERAHVEAATAEGDPDRYMRPRSQRKSQTRFATSPTQFAWLWDLPARRLSPGWGRALGIDEAAAHIEDMDACLVAFVGGVTTVGMPSTPVR